MSEADPILAPEPAADAADPEAGNSGQRRSNAQEDFKNKIKKDFIIKVYSILAAQILLTAGLVAFCIYHPSVGSAAEGLFFRWEPSVTSFFLSMLYYIPVMICLVALLMKGDEYPLNFFLLMLFTMLMAFPIGGACYSMVASGQGPAVLYATLVTSVIFMTITIIVACIKFEDSFMFFLALFLYALLMVNCFLGLFAILLGWSAGIWFYNVLGVVIFTGYILFDTWLILQKTEIEHADTRMAIFGAVKLYIDILNLFIHILSLMRRR
jgi:FtsH-binding integral membrane protein